MLCKNVSSGPKTKSLMRIFLALSFFFHSAAFAYLYLVSKTGNQQAHRLQSVEIENPQKTSKVKKHKSKVTAYQAEYGLADPSLKNTAELPGLSPSSDTIHSDKTVSFNERPLENKRESNTGGLETGFGSKSHSEIELTEIKIGKLLNTGKKLWILKNSQHEKIKHRAIEFLTGQAQIKTWYTLGLGSRTPDENDKKELVYYLRRLEHKINESGTLEQAEALAEINQKIYENLGPDLKTYWDSLTNNYRALNDWKRSPE
jgi:hypothetical protein